MTDIDIAYIAGLIDGEGYIGIKKNTDKKHGRFNDGYTERIQIRMVDEQAIKFIAESLGGNYYKEPPHSKGRPLYCYQASDLKAVHILETILPYLRVKKLVALNVLCLRRLKAEAKRITLTHAIPNRWGRTVEIGRRRYAPESIALFEKLWIECKEINAGKFG